jgi:hypothetical protein
MDLKKRFKAPLHDSPPFLDSLSNALEILA